MSLTRVLRYLLLVCIIATLDAFQVPITRCSRVTNVLSSTWPRKINCSGFSLPTHNNPRWTREELPQGRSKTSLAGFLPPSGGGSKKSELGDLVTTAFVFFGLAAFFISPLGGVFFAIFNSLLALTILVPVGAIVAFNVYLYFNTTTGLCPNCNAPVKVMNDESPSFCFTCGAVVQAKDGKIYLANPNNNLMENEEGGVFTTWIDGLSGVRRTPVDGNERRKTSIKTTKTTIIDVDVERDD